MENQCKATAKATGQRCEKPAMRGGLVCRSHGGAARQIRQAAARRTTEAEALAALAQMDVQPVDDPLSELAILAGEALQWKRLLKDRVSELSSLGYAGATGEQVRASVQLYGAALDRLERVLVSIARLNIDDRLAKVNERIADQLFTAQEAAFAELGVSAVTAYEIREATARHLRLVGGAA